MSGSCCLFILFLFLVLCSHGFSQLSPNQTSAIISLSRSIGISAWNFPGSEQNPCLWKGVSCSKPNNSSVTHLSFSGFGLSNSSFFPLVCKFETLESLDVSNNHLGSIPDEFITDCGKIDGLKLLNFSKNRFASLPSFHGLFTGLEVLDFSYNILSGSIGFEFDGLNSVKSLNLSFNNLTGSVPTNLGKSRSIEKLVISKNFLNGTIPDGITNYENLTLVDLSDNRLTGSIPSSIGNLSKLQIFILSNNHLGGEIPDSISTIKTLDRFAANQNDFSGAIPGGITTYLKNLDLSYNKLGGPIPLDLLSQSNLFAVDLSYNLLVGSVPPSISQSLVRLRLGSNKLNGSLPSGLFALLGRLTYLELDNNSLSGPIPRDLGSCMSLALLNLAQNEFTDVLPLELGNLTKLQVMKLQQNKLSGEIPVEIARLSMLSVLNISRNSLSGLIPSSISSLKKLDIMDLQGNNLTGPIPAGIGEINLIELQLGQNQLSGIIPRMPMSLQICLNLSHNHLEGSIPSTLSQLDGLEVLDLSNNRLSGEIPPSLTQLTSLTHLILSNNLLSGIIPKFSNRILFNWDGNPGLVNSTTISNTQRESSKKKRLVGVAIFISLAAAALVVGVVTVIALSLSRRFRRVKSLQLQMSDEDSRLPRLIQRKLLTANGIHRSNIDFTKSMEVVAEPGNIMWKTRFSTYYKAVMPSGTSYFIKKLNLSDKLFQLSNWNKLELQLEMLGKLSNSNVMVPLAYVLSSDTAYLFYEFAPKGILFDALHGIQGDALDWASRYSIAVAISQGIAFLHGCNNGPILLLDLSSRNIMLKSLKEPQIGDIELLKVIDPSKSTSSLSTVAGSIGYIPPEYAYTMRVTMAGNVYSFGVILLELLTGKPAVSEESELANWVLNYSMQQGNWDYILDPNISRRSSLAVRSQMIAVLKVALACISVSPEARPKMRSVLRMLVNAK